MVMDS